MTMDTQCSAAKFSSQTYRRTIELAREIFSLSEI